jgi:nicotinate-nucleotide adenylyltransferase
VASAEARLTMLQAAIADEPGFVLDDCEMHRAPPSYSVDTVEDIRQREGAAEFYYLVGHDNVPDLTRWHRFKDLEKLVQFIVLDRTGLHSKHDYKVVQRKIDISATEIRNRVASGQSIRYFVPTVVEEIIRQGNLYREQVK